MNKIGPRTHEQSSLSLSVSYIMTVRQLQERGTEQGKVHYSEYGTHVRFCEPHVLEENVY